MNNKAEKDGSPVFTGFFSWPVMLCIITLGLILTIMNTWHYPVLDDDSCCFLPIAISYAKGTGLVNSIWKPECVLDPLHPENLTWHGFLYPMFLGRCTPTPTYGGLLVVISVLQWALLGMSGFIFFRAVTEYGASGILRDVIVMAALLALCSLLPEIGRPEFFIAFLLALGLTGTFLLRFHWHWLVLGVTVGLMMATSPVPAVLAAQLVGIYVCVRLPFKQAFGFLTATGAVALATFGACFSLYPFTLAAWLRGMQLHASLVVVSVTSTMSEAIIRTPALLEFIFINILAICIGFGIVLGKPSQVRCRSGVIIFSLLYFGSIYYFWLRAPNHLYNVTWLSMIPILMLCCAGIHFAEQFKTKPSLRFATYAALCGCLLLQSVFFIRTVILFPYFIHYGMSFETAKAELQKARLKETDIAASYGLFALTEDYSNFHIFNTSHPTFNVLFVQQVNRGRLSPPAIPGYKLERDTFSPFQAKFLGIKLANTCGGYNFAIYRRDKSGLDTPNMAPMAPKN